MTRANRNPIAIQIVADLFRAEPLQHKREYASLLLSRADDAQPWNANQLARRIDKQCMLMP